MKVVMILMIAVIMFAPMDLEIIWKNGLTVDVFQADDDRGILLVIIIC